MCQFCQNELSAISWSKAKELVKRRLEGPRPRQIHTTIAEFEAVSLGNLLRDMQSVSDECRPRVIWLFDAATRPAALLIGHLNG